MSLFGNRVTVLIHVIKSRSYWSRMDNKSSMTGCVRDSDMYRGCDVRDRGNAGRIKVCV